MGNYHIVYATDHTFAFICAVATASLLKHKKEKDQYIVHILTDGSLNDEDYALFNRLEKECVNSSIIIDSIKNPQIEGVDMSNTYLTKMTFYRLLLPEILNDVDKCIYLDADTLVFDDISLLMSYDISEYYVAAVIDDGIKKVSYDNFGGFNLDEYFNAGVMLMNLDKIREDGLKNKFFSLINVEWPFHDQDILNKVCIRNVLFIDSRFNRFSYCASEEDDSVVVHFLGDAGMRPWQYLKANRADDWWEVASIFKDTSIYKDTRRQVEEKHKKASFKYAIEQCKVHDSIFIFGCGFYGKKIEKSLARNGVLNVEAFLDNNDKVVGTEVAGHKVISPGEVDYHKDNYYIISVRNTKAQESIEHQLLSLGATKEQILCYIENPPEAYHYMDPKYQAEEIDNILLRELGSGTARMGWDFNRYR